jgi:inosine-uridine nucleoside N-ribohydrolase
VYAAPFHNDRSTGPGDGMEKSYAEIEEILGRLDVSTDDFAYRGSTTYLQKPLTPVESSAAHDLVRRANEGDSPLYVLAIGAITNVASAILIDPSIRSKIVLVWLGGHPHHHPHAMEFNLQQDIYASQVVFDSGVPLVQIPCAGVASHLITTLAELEKDMGRDNPICDFLVGRFEEYSDDHFAWGKVIWDIAAVAWILNPSWVPTWISHSPRLSTDIRWSPDEGRHFVRVAHGVNRNAVFQDMFRKLRAL